MRALLLAVMLTAGCAEKEAVHTSALIDQAADVFHGATTIAAETSFRNYQGRQVEVVGKVYDIEREAGGFKMGISNMGTSIYYLAAYFPAEAGPELLQLKKGDAVRVSGRIRDAGETWVGIDGASLLEAKP